jgi:hypothetical protein
MLVNALINFGSPLEFAEMIHFLFREVTKYLKELIKTNLEEIQSYKKK